MQTNLHRVSEVAVTAKPLANDEKVKPATKTAVKRFLEHDSDSESEVDDGVGSSKMVTALPDPKSEGADIPRSENAELETTVFLSFDWENEGPYEKAVERYITFYIFVVAVLVHIYSYYV